MNRRNLLKSSLALSGGSLLASACKPTVKSSSAESRFSPENLKQNLALVELVKNWAAQISLAWLLAQKPWIVPIPGTTQMAHMLDNTGGDNVKFTADEIKQFNSEVAAIHMEGARLPPFVEALSGVEAPPKK